MSHLISSLPNLLQQFRKPKPNQEKDNILQEDIEASQLHMANSGCLGPRCPGEMRTEQVGSRGYELQLRESQI